MLSLLWYSPHSIQRHFCKHSDRWLVVQWTPVPTRYCTWPACPLMLSYVVPHGLIPNCLFHLLLCRCSETALFRNNPQNNISAHCIFRKDAPTFSLCCSAAKIRLIWNTCVKCGELILHSWIVRKIQLYIVVVATECVAAPRNYWCWMLFYRALDKSYFTLTGKSHDI